MSNDLSLPEALQQLARYTVHVDLAADRAYLQPIRYGEREPSEGVTVIKLSDVLSLVHAGEPPPQAEPLEDGVRCPNCGADGVAYQLVPWSDPRCRACWGGYLDASLEIHDEQKAEIKRLSEVGEPPQTDPRLLAVSANVVDLAAYAEQEIGNALAAKESPDDIVGHKTFSTGRTGSTGFPELRHEPLTRGEAKAIIAAVEQEKAQRAANMPNEQTAIAVLFDAYERLKELGWKDAIYCPKDGSTFQVIEAGNTGIHKCHYQGKWPTGTWWVHGDGDLWPSRPILFKLAALGESGSQPKNEPVKGE